MGSILMKVLYDKWVNGHPLPNGMHPAAINAVSHLHDKNQIRDYIEKNIGVIFRWHDNFYRYTVEPGLLDAVDLDSVDKNDEELYIYPIEILNIKPLFTRAKFNGLNKSCYLHETFSRKLMKLAVSGKIKFVINLTHDPIMLTEIRNIENYFSSVKINLNNIIIVAGNYQKNTKLNVIESSTFFAHESAKEMMNFPFVGSLGYEADIVREKDLDGSLRPKHFLNLNRASRQHRYYLLYELVEKNLIDKCIISFISPMNNTVGDIQSWLKNYCDGIDAETIKRANNMLPIELDTKSFKDKTGFPSNQTNKDWYTNSYISIVSETDFLLNDYPFNSEKTFRPFVNLHPFIHFGNVGAIQLLHNLGFKTFAPYINEDYAYEDNKKKRAQLLIKEVERLGNMPIDEIHTLYYNLKDTLLYNQEHLKTFIDTNPYIELFEKIEKIYR